MNAVAIIVAGALVGASILYAQSLDRFQISATQGANDVPVVWRMDTRNGTLSVCYPEKLPDGKFKATCQ